MQKIGSEPSGARIKTIYKFENIKTRNDAVNLLAKISKYIRLGLKNVQAKGLGRDFDGSVYDPAEYSSTKIIKHFATANVDTITVSGIYKGYMTTFEMDLKTKHLGIICFKSKLNDALPELESIITSLQP